MKKVENKNTLVIFGAPDHEEAMARKIAENAGCMTATATCNGTPVHVGDAYRANGHRNDFGGNDWPETVVLFECGKGSFDFSAISPGPKAVVCDHHNPGDPGYGRPASEYWIGSSLGQLCYALELYEELPDLQKKYKLLMVAAGDHCPADAYAGNCPAIDPTEFAEFRIRQQAEFKFAEMEPEAKKNSTIEGWICAISDEIQDVVHRVLPHAKLVNGIYDLREYGTIPNLPEAALSVGAAYMAKIDERDRAGELTGNKKIVLGGHTTSKQVEDFIVWASGLANKVGEPYGNPTRGYAGVVVTDPYCPTCKGEYLPELQHCPTCGAEYQEVG